MPYRKVRVELPNRETRRFILFLSASFAIVLVASALLFSTFLEWRGQVSQYSRSGARSAEPCLPSHAHDSETIDSTGKETLTPLDPSQEELLNADNTLAPAEILGLSENVESLTAPLQDPEPSR